MNIRFLDRTWLFYPLDLMHDVLLFLYVSYSIQYCFIKVFLKASIVCIFYEHFVFCVYTLTRFIRGNKIKGQMFHVSFLFLLSTSVKVSFLP